MEEFLVTGGPEIINLLRIPGEQQIMLRVTVAEVNRAAARSIGMNFNILNSDGGRIFAQSTGSIATGGLSGGLSFTGLGSVQSQGTLGSAPGVALGPGGFNNLPASIDNGQVNLAINALRVLNYAKSLAEPNLVALNGQSATFHAGGQFPVPVVTGYTASGLQGVEFVDYGVRLNFTPYITDRDRIRLSVSADVSSRDLDNGGSNVGGNNIPNLITRNFQTVVELREGQTLAVAGLIQTNAGAVAHRIPLIGDLPVVGRLASFDRIQAGEQELIVLITPVLVHPLDCHQVPALPGHDLFEPDDLEFYVLGRLESHLGMDYRSTVRTDFDRIKMYRKMEHTYLSGPHGYSLEK
jgi:pilus assembly protein CpaC